MLDTSSLHRKVQDMADCYKGTDFLKEMSRLPSDQDTEEAATKWLALAVLHGVNANAEEVSIRRHGDGQVTVQAKYRRANLPSPGQDIGEKIIEAIREITHLEADKAKGLLAFGLGADNLELRVKVKKKGDQETATLEFPK